MHTGILIGPGADVEETGRAPRGEHALPAGARAISVTGLVRELLSSTNCPMRHCGSPARPDPARPEPPR
ncbi:MAG TPA: hypothetical protein VGH89_33365 [Pseudonocardia sp.]